jgi:MFS family permease
MSETPAPATPEAPRPSPWRRNLILLAVALVVIVLAYLIGGAVLPRWWAHRIGDQVDGSMLAGIGLGLFYGVVFTFLPLLVLWLAVRRKRSWRFRAWIAVAALALAIPNLLTLGIVVGNGSAAHAGERTLDVEGPDFRASTLVGAVIAVLAFVALRYVLASRRRSRAREKSLREELKARDEAS